MYLPEPLVIQPLRGEEGVAPAPFIQIACRVQMTLQTVSSILRITS
jgi:hypothetical protein